MFLTQYSGEYSIDLTFINENNILQVGVWCGSVCVCVWVGGWVGVWRGEWSGSAHDFYCHATFKSRFLSSISCR